MDPPVQLQQPTTLIEKDIISWTSFLGSKSPHTSASSTNFLLFLHLANMLGCSFMLLDQIVSRLPVRREYFLFSSTGGKNKAIKPKSRINNSPGSSQKEKRKEKTPGRHRDLVRARAVPKSSRLSHSPSPPSPHGASLCLRQRLCAVIFHTAGLSFSWFLPSFRFIAGSCHQHPPLTHRSDI